MNLATALQQSNNEQDHLSLQPQQIHLQESEIAAFPMIAKDWPCPEQFDNPYDYHRCAGSGSRSWIVHLAAVAKKSLGSKFEFCRFADKEDCVLENTLRELDIQGGYSVYPKEIVYGEKDRIDDYSPWTTGLDLCVRGKSYRLAMAVAIIAAHRKEHQESPLSNRILFSGDIQEGCRLREVGCLDEKIELASGLGWNTENLTNILQKMLEHEPTRRKIGSYDSRTTPKNVDLFIVASTLMATDEAPIIDLEHFELRKLTTISEDWTKIDWKELANGGLIVAMVDNLGDVLELANIPRGVEKRPKTARFYRVTLAQSKPIRGGKEEALKEVFKYKGARKSSEERLEILLRLLATEIEKKNRGVKCIAAKIDKLFNEGYSSRIVSFQNPDILSKNPFGELLVQSIVQEEKSLAISDVKKDFRFSDIQDIRSLIAIPIFSNTRFRQVIGVMCFGFDTIVDRWKKGLIDICTEFSSDAAIEIDRMQNERCIPSVPNFTYPSDESEPYIWQVRKTVGQEIVNWACSIPGVSRAALQLIDPEKTELTLVADKGYQDFSAIPHERKIDLSSASGKAIVERKSQWIGNTHLHREKGLNGYQVIVPEQPAVCALHLQSNNFDLGVLTIDWKIIQEFDSLIRQQLDRRAQTIADKLRQVSSIFEQSELEKIFQKYQSQKPTGVTEPPSIDSVKSRFESFLGEILAKMEELIDYWPRPNKQGKLFQMIYQLEPKTERYEGFIQRGHRDGWKDSWQKVPELWGGVAPAQGLIGWAAKNKRTICVRDRRDQEELKKIEPNEENRPTWLNTKFFDEEFGEDKLAYLAIPIIIDDHVAAVYRLAHNRPEFEFSLEQQALAKYAARLISQMYQIKQTAQAQAANLYQGLLGPEKEWSLPKICEYYFHILEKELGSIYIAIREKDQVDGEPALRLVFGNEIDPQEKDFLFRFPQSPGLVGRILNFEHHKEIWFESDRDIGKFNPEGDKWVQGLYQKYARAFASGLYSRSNQILGSICIARTDKLLNTDKGNSNYFTTYEMEVIRAIADRLEKEIAEYITFTESRFVAEANKILLQGFTSEGTYRNTIIQLRDIIKNYLSAENSEVFLYNIRTRQHVHERGFTRLNTKFTWFSGFDNQNFQIVSLPYQKPEELLTFFPSNSDIARTRSRAVLMAQPDDASPFIMTFLAYEKYPLSWKRLKFVSDFLTENKQFLDLISMRDTD